MFIRRENMFIASKLWNTEHAKERVEAACRKTLDDLCLVIGFIVIVIVIVRMPHICGMDTYGMKIMPQMSGIATFQDIYGMLIFEDEHAIDV